MARQEKLDRRSRRSRRLIVDALLGLMLEKRYDRITVQEVIDRADVGRTTFYTQFRGKEDVLASEFERVFGLLHAERLSAAADPADQLLPSLGLFRHVRAHRVLFLALVRGQAMEPHEVAVRRYLRDGVLRQLTLVSGSRQLAVPPEIIANYLVGVLLDLVRWWLDQGLLDPPERMERIFHQLAMPGVRALLQDVE